MIIDDREDPHVGSIDTHADAFENHRAVGRGMYAINKNFRFALETPIAVTGARSVPETASVISNRRAESFDAVDERE